MIRKHPRPSNLKNRDVEALFLAIGYTRVEGKGSAVAFMKTGGAPFMYHRPHPRPDIDKGAVAALDKYFETEGVYEDIGI